MSEGLIVVTLLSGICASVGSRPVVFAEDRERRFHVLLFGVLCIDAAVYFFR